jgi:O-antigen ligase
MNPSRAMAAGLRSDELLTSVLLMIVLCLVYVGALALFGSSPMVFAVLPALAMVLLLVSNLEFAFMAVVASLFIEYPVSWFSLSVWIALPLGLSVFLRFRNEASWSVTTPLTKAIVIYGLCVLPSVITSEVPFASLYKMLNVVAFLVVLYGSIISLRTPKAIRMLVLVFLGATLLNSLHVIFESQLLQLRSYGFAGIMFVDFSAIGLCIVAAMAMTSGRTSRILLGSCAVIISMALVLTQTRNTWVSAFVTLTFLAVYALIYPDRIGLTRDRVLGLVSVGVIVIGLSAGVALALNPGVERRATELASASADEPAVSGAGKVSNSLVSRALIWSTALNAFSSNPLTGIGAYAFPFVSKSYSTIPPILYHRFVRNLTPHQTHLAVLSETGLIGFLGFLVFILTSLRIALKAVARAVDPKRRRIAFVAMTATIYVMTSMFFTDAWLWGPLVVLFGLILGVTIANDTYGREERASAIA